MVGPDGFLKTLCPGVPLLEHPIKTGVGFYSVTFKFSFYHCIWSSGTLLLAATQGSNHMLYHHSKRFSMLQTMNTRALTSFPSIPG